MESRELTVRVDHDGPVCVLAFAGDLDLIAARGVVTQVVDAMPGLAAAGRTRAERVVLDLSGLTFLDCAGARALLLVTQAVPAGCPVIVRAVSPVASRVLGLLEMNLEHVPAASAAGYPRDWAGELVRRSLAMRASIRQIRGQMAGTAAAVASTEGRIAATMTRVAGQQPHRAARLTELAEQARRCAQSSRKWADELSAQPERVRGGVTPHPVR